MLETETQPEASPLWGIVLILGEIAGRVERRLAEEHVGFDEVRVAEHQVDALIDLSTAEGSGA